MGNIGLCGFDQTAGKQLEKAIVASGAAVKWLKGRSLDAVSMTAVAECDCIVLLLKRDGSEFWAKLSRSVQAASPTPLILVSNVCDESETVACLEMGCDDCISVNSSARVMVAKILVVARRARGAQDPWVPIVFGPLKIDLAAREALLMGENLSLTGAQMGLMAELARSSGRIVPRDVLLGVLGSGDSGGYNRNLDVHICHLRGKLAGSPLRIVTVRGSGYQLCPVL
jgi:DNA-binding response OmpR family regulator